MRSIAEKKEELKRLKAQVEKLEKEINNKDKGDAKLKFLEKILNHKNVVVINCIKENHTYIIEIDNVEWSISNKNCVKTLNSIPIDESYAISFEDFYKRFVLGVVNHPENHYKAWSKEDYAILEDLVADDYRIEDAAQILKRYPRAIFMKSIEKKYIQSCKPFEAYSPAEKLSMKFTDFVIEEPEYNKMHH